MSEAWRGFCRQVAGFLSFTSVAVQGLLGAGHLSTQVLLRAAAGLSRSSEASNGITVKAPYTEAL
jgi:hypothetical protein